jgi:hypothetical protein
MRISVDGSFAGVDVEAKCLSPALGGASDGAEPSMHEIEYGFLHRLPHTMTVTDMCLAKPIKCSATVYSVRCLISHNKMDNKMRRNAS